MCVFMTTQWSFMPLRLCFKKTDIFCEFSEKIAFKTFHIFMTQFIVYYIKTYSIQEDLSEHIYNMPGAVSIYFLTTKCPGTVWRGCLHLKGTLNCKSKEYHLNPLMLR